MPKFTWERYDSDGKTTYVIRKKLCPDPKDLPEFIVREDNLPEHYKQRISECEVMEGMGRWEFRRDWENGDGEIKPGFFIQAGKFKPKNGGFNVWIVSGEDW